MVYGRISQPQQCWHVRLDHFLVVVGRDFPMHCNVMATSLVSTYWMPATIPRHENQKLPNVSNKANESWLRVTGL